MTLDDRLAEQFKRMDGTVITKVECVLFVELIHKRKVGECGKKQG